MKVNCTLCKKELASSSLKGHMARIHKVGSTVGTTTTPAGEKTTNTTPVEERVEVASRVEMVEVASSTTTSGSTVTSATSGGSQVTAPGVGEEETNFIEMTKEKIKTTEGVLIEAQDDAEIFVCVEQAE